MVEGVALVWYAHTRYIFQSLARHGREHTIDSWTDFSYCMDLQLNAQTVEEILASPPGLSG